MGESISTILGDISLDLTVTDEDVLRHVIDYLEDLVRAGTITTEGFHEAIMTKIEEERDDEGDLELQNDEEKG